MASSMLLVSSEPIMRVIDVLQEPKTGVPIAMAAWATLHQVFSNLPGLRDKPFSFVVSIISPPFGIDSDDDHGGRMRRMWRTRRNRSMIFTV